MATYASATQNISGLCKISAAFPPKSKKVIKRNSVPINAEKVVIVSASMLKYDAFLFSTLYAAIAKAVKIARIWPHGVILAFARQVYTAGALFDIVITPIVPSRAITIPT